MTTEKPEAAQRNNIKNGNEFYKQAHYFNAACCVCYMLFKEHF